MVERAWYGDVAESSHHRACPTSAQKSRAQRSPSRGNVLELWATILVTTGVQTWSHCSHECKPVERWN
eukprot:scaffold1261_cov155-Skeletonema_menzelii.AAC.2